MHETVTVAEAAGLEEPSHLLGIKSDTSQDLPLTAALEPERDLKLRRIVANLKVFALVSGNYC